MKSYVITIMDLPESVAAAERCIASMPEFNVQMFPAITPKDNPEKMLKDKGIQRDWFTSMDQGKFSRMHRVISAFMSHYSLWEKCRDSNEEIQIFEHDAVRVGNLPEFINYQGCISLGAPSYGQFETPRQMGVIPLTSKSYFPGAHAYRMKPAAAKIIIEVAREYGAATDVFLSRSWFPWLEEYYPWPVVVKETFSTIQNEGGCVAKHGYNKDTYKLL